MNNLFASTFTPRQYRRIEVRRLRAHASIGILPHEVNLKQPIVMDADVYVDRNVSTPKRDSISEVLDYREIRERVLNTVSAQHTNLLETLCDRVGATLLELPGVAAVRIKIDKPNAFDDAESVGIEVFHFKDGV